MLTRPQAELTAAGLLRGTVEIRSVRETEAVLAMRAAPMLDDLALSHPEDRSPVDDHS